MIPRSSDPGRAVAALAAGGVIAYPTESVYGLGCDARDAAAVARVNALKGRPGGKGLICLVDAPERVADWLATTRDALQRASVCWPGPVTWLIPASGTAPSWLRGDSDEIALRVPGLPLALELCQRFGGPIVSTSANPAGAEPARTAAAVAACFRAGLDLILDGACGGRERPSEIRRLTTGEVLR